MSRPATKDWKLYLLRRFSCFTQAEAGRMIGISGRRYRDLENAMPVKNAVVLREKALKELRRRAFKTRTPERVYLLLCRALEEQEPPVVAFDLACVILDLPSYKLTEIRGKNTWFWWAMRSHAWFYEKQTRTHQRYALRTCERAMSKMREVFGERIAKGVR